MGDDTSGGGSDNPSGAGSENTIEVSVDGPLRVVGDLRLRHANDPDAAVYTALALCRCGASANKPLCDGSHERCGFQDPGLVPAPPTTGLVSGDRATTGAPLVIIASPDGPLVCVGPHVIRGADGATVRRDKSALCRCGSSARKPFCDGAHGECGFVADDQFGVRRR